MATFQEQLKKAKKLTPKRVSKDLFEFIRSLERTLAQFNKGQLFIDSKDVDGNPIGFYSPGTEKITKGRKKAGDPFNLFEEGKLLGSLIAKVQISERNILFDFTDPKKNEVFKNLLSENILGLSDENLQIALRTPAKEFLQKYYRRKLDL